MIEKVFKIVGINTKNKEVRLHDCLADKILDKDQQKWNYRYTVGCLSYIQAMIGPDITVEVQQCALFFNDPSQEHKESIKSICRYLLNTKAQGITLRPDKKKLLECYANTAWAGSWQHW